MQLLKKYIKQEKNLAPYFLELNKNVKFNLEEAIFNSKCNYRFIDGVLSCNFKNNVKKSCLQETFLKKRKNSDLNQP
jgi:hypothetical protein